jgi:hypothetical protein
MRCSIINLLAVSIVLALGATSDAEALTPPIGWVRVAADRAVLNADHPDHGMIYEFRIADGNGKPEELVAALLEEGIAIERFGIEPNGLINLVGPERLGRARQYWEPQVSVWWAVLAAPNEASRLDPDALLQSLSPSPTGVDWGAKEVLGAGPDGSPWGQVSALNKDKAGGWGISGSQAEWSQDAAVVGQWECSVLLRGITTRLRFYFESNGELRIQAITSESETVKQGRWATRDRLMQMDIESGGANLPYITTKRTLSVPYAGARLVLYKL